MPVSCQSMQSFLKYLFGLVTSRLKVSIALFPSTPSLLCVSFPSCGYVSLCPWVTLTTRLPFLLQASPGWVASLGSGACETVASLMEPPN